MDPQLSLIIAFYRKTRELGLIFETLRQQTFTNFEVIIADDGSDAPAVNELNRLIQDAGSFPVKHVRHEKDGWRKNAILNKAILASRGEYLVFIDGDCLLHPCFLHEHYRYREMGLVLGGRRVMLSEKITAGITPGFLGKKNFACKLALRAILDSLRKSGCSHIENGIYLGASPLKRFFNKKPRNIQGCNFSMHKADFLSINGFDERFNGPGGGEDDDVHYRGLHFGLRFATLKFLAVQFHLYHRTLDRPLANFNMMEENRKNKVGVTPYGIRKLEI